MPLTTSTINPNVLAAQYAVRGAIATRAEEIRAELRKSPNKFPFKQVINANIGNPQQLDQKPVTFYRQVLALVQYPDLLKNPVRFAPDAVRRASTLLESVHSVGAYSTSAGIEVCRQSVAKFIEKRDGFPADHNNIFLSGGASAAVHKILELVTTSEKSAILIPIPQYPLYSATISLLGAQKVGYYLEENNDWSTGPEHVEEQILKAKAEGLEPKLLAVINPGNPTGAVLSRSDIEDLCRVALKYDLVLLADEVYQANVFKGEFLSFKKIRSELVEKDPKFSELQLASVHSTSKGTIGECGQRGGYLEIVGFPPEAREQIVKMASIQLCPVVTGQVLTELMVNPPQPGDESYEQFIKETTGIFDTYRKRAKILYDTFQELEGVECNPPEGAMYLFPRITVPSKACEEAKKRSLSPDGLYCMELLEHTGICVVSGTGFGQEPGTHHFRTTFLAPPSDDFTDMFVKFHSDFMNKYK